jgi:hypothetical protein
MRGGIRIGLQYTYERWADAILADFNMEAQGDVLADYFALKHLRQPGVMRQRQYAGSLGLYESVLALFLSHPKDRCNLPSRIKLPFVNRKV